jgi:signal transduction histidine kinase
MLRNGHEAPPASLPMQRAVAETRSIVNQEYEIVRNDGFRITVVVSATPIFDDEGRVTGCVSTYTDVTERKAAEIALQNLNETLEQRVAERTAELEQINRELVEFTNVVSHDLRAPLRAITALSEWINEEADAVLPATSKEHLAKMRQRVERMERLLNDLTAYTRAGRVHYRKEQVNTATLVQDIVTLLDTQNGFHASVVAPMPMLVTERVPLETVLRNLIGNAYKHHHSPQMGNVSISANDVGDAYEFVVRDDGPGIAPEHQQRIFGVFQTLRPRDEVEGSGMGLAIAKRLVEGRGGQIQVESHPGEGSTFRFTWPK